MASRHPLESLLAEWGAPQVHSEPVGEPRPVKLSVGIATYDDFDGAYFTVHSLLLHHASAMRDAEIVVLDNHPGGPASESLMAMAGDYPDSANVRYVPYGEVRSTAVRDVLFRETRGDVVLVLDSHVLVAAGGVDALLDYFEQPSHARDMVQGPMTSSSGQELAATQMVPVFRNGMYGKWEVDPRGTDPTAEAFEISMHGLGLFAMRRDFWPGLNPRFRGFGAEEGYIQEKVRQAGGRVVCLPALRWQHRFLRPGGPPYPNRWPDRIHNYLVGWTEIGYDLAPVVEHFSELLGPSFGDLWSGVQREVAHPLRCVDGVIVLSDDTRVAPWASARVDLEAAGIEAVRAPVVSTDRGRAADTVSALNDALERARYRGWRNVVVLDEAWSLDLGLAHAVARVVEARQPVRTMLLAQSTDTGTFLPGPLVTDTSSGPPVATLAEWLSSRDGSMVDVGAAPPGRAARLRLADVLAAAYVSGYSEDRDDWLALYRTLSASGMGLTAHRAPLVDLPTTTPGTDRRRSVQARLTALADGESPPEGPVLFLADDVSVLLGFDHVLARAVLEASARPWDVLSLAGAAGSTRAMPLPGCALLSRREQGNSGCAFLVHPDALSRVGELLSREDRDDRADPVGSLLDAAVESGLTVLAVEPGVFAPRELLRGPSAQRPLRHRYERPAT